MFSRLCKPASKPNRTYLNLGALRKTGYSTARSLSGFYRLSLPGSAAKDQTSLSSKQTSVQIKKSGKKNLNRNSQRHVGPQTLRPLRKAAKALQALNISTGSSSEVVQDHVTMAQLAALPLSPVVDPKIIQRRARWKQPKLHAGPTTPFEHEIAANPYAQMLATPVRACAISSARVPSAFLRPFTLCKDPSSDAIWQLPKDLDPAPLESDNNLNSLSKQESNRTGQLPISNSRSPLNTSFPACWVSNSPKGMEYMTHRKRMVATPRWRAVLSASVHERTRVKEDNAEMVLKLLQRKCVRELAILHQGDSHGRVTSIVPWISPLEDLARVENSIEESLPSFATKEEGVLAGPGTAVLLWLGGQLAVDHFPTDIRERLFGTRSAPVQHPVIRTSTKRAIPVIDGEFLLGENSLPWLQARSDIFRHAAVLITMTPTSRSALRWIWTLHLYQSSN